MPTPRIRRSILAGLLAAPLLLGLAACGDDGGSSDERAGASAPATGRRPRTSPSTSATSRTSPTPRRSSACGEGIFEENLPENVTLETADLQRRARGRRGALRRRASTSPTSARTRPSTPSPSPTARPCASSPARPPAAPPSSTTPDITSPEQLEGTELATPQLGNTQDVALRAYLADEGFETDETGGGDVSIRPAGERRHAHRSSSPATSTAPGCPSRGRPGWSHEGGGHVLVDEADLWPGGEFVTTHVIVRTEFLEDHPDVVEAFLAATSPPSTAIEDDPAAAQATVNDADRGDHRRAALAETVIAGAWENLGSPTTRSPRRWRSRRPTPRRSACSTRSTSTASTT